MNVGRRQPQIPTGGNLNSPFYGLKFLFNGAFPTRQFVPNVAPLVASGTPTALLTDAGQGMTFAGSQYYTGAMNGWSFGQAVPFTLAVMVRRLITGIGNKGSVYLMSGTPNAAGSAVGFRTNDSSPFQNCAAVGVQSLYENLAAESVGLSIGATAFYIATSDGATNYSLFKNGIFQSTAGFGSFNGPFTGTVIVGSQPSVVGSRNYDGSIFMAAGWNHCLSASEIFALSQNPWQLFAFNKRATNYVDAAAAAVIQRRSLRISQAVNRASTY